MEESGQRHVLATSALGCPLNKRLGWARAFWTFGEKKIVPWRKSNRLFLLSGSFR